MREEIEFDLTDEVIKSWEENSVTKYVMNELRKRRLHYFESIINFDPRQGRDSAIDDFFYEKGVLAGLDMLLGIVFQGDSNEA